MVDVDEISFPEMNVKVWNYDRKADEYITDPAVRQRLDQIASANVGRWFPVRGIGIISVGKIDWREYTEEEAALCSEIRLLLFIHIIASTATIERGANTGHYQFTTDNFTQYIQGFGLETSRMAIQSGFIVRKRDMGLDLATIKFQQPDYVPSPTLFRSDKSLLKDLLTLRKTQKKLYRRLLIAFEALSQAYTNDTTLNTVSRIPILASAYESLFDLPEQNQRRELKNFFRSHIAPTSSRKIRFTSQRRNGFAWEVDDLSVMWADKFYTLRNKIIHGKAIKSGELSFRGKQDHFDIAVIFFIFGLKKIISMKPRIKDTIDEVRWKVHQEEEDEKYEGFVYEDYDMFRGL